jgi:hypothetical protein
MTITEGLRLWCLTPLSTITEAMICPDIEALKVG